MILSLAIFKVFIAALVTGAIWLIERAFEKRAWPRRWLWIIAVALTCALPLVAVSRDWAPQPAGRQFIVGSIENPGPGVVGRLRADYQQILVTQPRFDDLLESLTLTIRVAGGLLLAVGWMAQHAILRAARPAVVADTPVLISDGPGPAVLGFLKPKMLVPQWMVGLPRTTSDLALAHERAHIRAGDPLCFLALLVLAIATADVASIGFVIWQIRRFRFAVEIDCDRRVLTTADRGLYAQALLAIAQRRCGALVGAMALVERTSELERRIQLMTADPVRESYKFTSMTVLFAGVLLIAAAMLDAPLQPYPRLVQWVHTHKEVPLAPEALGKFAGVYVTDAGGPPVEFKVEGQRLVTMNAPSTAAFQAGDVFAPTGGADFLLVTPPRRTTKLGFADFDAEGRPSRLVENSRGHIAVFQRVPAAP